VGTENLTDISVIFAKRRKLRRSGKWQNSLFYLFTNESNENENGEVKEKKEGMKRERKEQNKQEHTNPFSTRFAAVIKERKQ